MGRPQTKGNGSKARSCFNASCLPLSFLRCHKCSFFFAEALCFARRTTGKSWHPNQTRWLFEDIHFSAGPLWLVLGLGSALGEVLLLIARRGICGAVFCIFFLSEDELGAVALCICMRLLHHSP